MNIIKKLKKLVREQEKSKARRLSEKNKVSDEEEGKDEEEKSGGGKGKKKRKRSKDESGYKSERLPVITQGQRSEMREKDNITNPDQQSELSGLLQPQSQ